MTSNLVVINYNVLSYSEPQAQRPLELARPGKEKTDSDRGEEEHWREGGSNISAFPILISGWGVSHFHRFDHSSPLYKVKEPNF